MRSKQIKISYNISPASLNAFLSSTDIQGGIFLEALEREWFREEKVLLIFPENPFQPVNVIYWNILESSSCFLFFSFFH